MYRKVGSTRPVYYSILNSFGQRSQYISIKFPLHKQSWKSLNVLLTETVYCSRLYGNLIATDDFGFGFANGWKTIHSVNRDFLLYVIWILLEYKGGAKCPVPVAWHWKIQFEYTTDSNVLNCNNHLNLFLLYKAFCRHSIWKVLVHSHSLRIKYGLVHFAWYIHKVVCL